MECSALRHPSKAHTEEEACTVGQSEAEKIHSKETTSKHGVSTAVMSSQQLRLSSARELHTFNISSWKWAGPMRPPLSLIGYSSLAVAGEQRGNFLLTDCPCACRQPPTHAQARTLLVTQWATQKKKREKRRERGPVEKKAYNGRRMRKRNRGGA